MITGRSSVTDSVSFQREIRNIRLQQKRRRALITAATTTAPRLVEHLAHVPPEDMERLHSGGVKALRKVLERVERQSANVADDTTSIATASVEHSPTQIIRKSHRPSVLPGLVPQTPSPRTQRLFSHSLIDLKAMLANGESSFAVLDHMYSTTGLSWDQCTTIIAAHGRVLDSVTREMTADARHFWTRLSELKQVYRNAVNLGHVRAAEGDWAFVEYHELEDWLPGIHAPAMHRRDHYLVRITSRGGSLLNLDFYSNSYLPLFRVPL